MTTSQPNTLPWVTRQSESQAGIEKTPVIATARIYNQFSIKRKKIVSVGHGYKVSTEG